MNENPLDNLFPQPPPSEFKSESSSPFEPEQFPEIEKLLLETPLLETPLYETYDLSNYTYGQITGLGYFKGQIDSYCLDCNRQSVFLSQKVNEIREPNETVFLMGTSDQHKEKVRSFYLMLTCARDADHLMVFYFKIYEKKLIKVGQFPSLADLQSHDVAIYRKALSKERFKDFKRGIGLAAHGIGVAIPN